jgi:acyl-CoA dehydrogenase
MSKELIDAVEDLLFQTCTHAELQTAEADGWSPRMWAAVAAMGLPWISVPEEHGGQGGTLTDAFDVLRVAGRHALAVPLAETGLLGGWLLASVQMQVPGTPVTVIPGHPQDSLAIGGDGLTGIAHAVPWARAASHIVTLVQMDDAPHVLCVPQEQVSVTAMNNLAGEPRDTVHFDGVSLASARPAAPGINQDAVRQRGALTRVVLSAGALDRVLDITVRYTSERQQFGRPVGRFQAVQQHLVHLAQQAALLGAAADVAVRETANGRGSFEVAAAKSLSADAVHVATRAAHQAHGAMGMTQEYALHHLTRRLWSWRAEYGEGTGWARAIGGGIVRRGADRLFPLIADGSLELAR